MTGAARTWAGIAALALLCYPIVFYFSYDMVGLSGLALAFAALALVRVLTVPGLAAGRRALAATAVVGFALAVAYWHSSSLLKLYPVAVNGSLLGYGLYTLLHPPSAIERLVRALGQPVSTAGVPYTRNVTLLWCGFFAINGSVAGYTALAAPTSAWAWYNGAASYALAAALFAGELMVRGVYRRRVERSGGADTHPSEP